MNLAIQNNDENNNNNDNENDSYLTMYRSISVNSELDNTDRTRCERECIPCQYGCMRIMEVFILIAYTVFYVEYSIISTIETESICNQFKCIEIWYSMIIQGFFIASQLVLHIYLIFTSNFIQDSNDNYISFYRSKLNLILNCLNVLVLISNGVEIYIVIYTCEELEYSDKWFSIFLNMFSVMFFLGLSLVTDIYQPYIVPEYEYVA